MHKTPRLQPVAEAQFAPSLTKTLNGTGARELPLTRQTSLNAKSSDCRRVKKYAVCSRSRTKDYGRWPSNFGQSSFWLRPAPNAQNLKITGRGTSTRTLIRHWN